MTHVHHEGEGREARDGLDDQVAAELAALGEAPLDADELAVDDFAVLGDRGVVQATATLVDLSRWTPPSDTADELLPELSRHRVWRRIVKAAKPEHRSAASANDSGSASGFRGWRGVVAGLGLVAGVALVPRFSAEAPPAPTDSELATRASMGDALRTSVEVFGDRDHARADKLVADYEARLASKRGQR